MTETNAERLERIKSGSITGGDIPFIVKGFERLEKLELRAQGGLMADKLISAHVKDLERENMRLREALQDIADGAGPPCLAAKSALEGIK